MVDVAVEYVVLAARAARLLPGLADVPRAASACVAAEPRPAASALVRAAGRLAAAVPGAGLAPPRARFLGAQLAALEGTVQRLAGQSRPFVDEVRATFGASGELADLLPGRGPVADRLAAHRRRDAVPPDRLLTALQTVSDALGARSPWAGGRMEWRLVTDAPWAALHTWRGAGRSGVTELARSPSSTAPPGAAAPSASEVPA